MNDYLVTLKAVTRSMYDMQKLRISIGNRICGNFRVKLGQDPGKKSDKEKDKMIKIVMKEYKRLADALVDLSNNRKEFKKHLEKQGGVITNMAEYELLNMYADILQKEKDQEKVIKPLVEHIPIRKKFLSKIKGCGPLMSAVIITYFDPHKAATPSAFWKYSGLDVAHDGRGRSKRKEHQIKVKYTSKAGKEEEKNSITYNPLLKTKLMGVLGSCFLRAQEKCPYTEIYYNTKNRLDNHEKYKDEIPMHKHLYATRKMIKAFLVDLWTEWRKLEGLEVREPYHVEKLGMRKHESHSSKETHARVASQIAQETQNDLASQIA